MAAGHAGGLCGGTEERPGEGGRAWPEGALAHQPAGSPAQAQRGPRGWRLWRCRGRLAPWLARGGEGGELLQGCQRSAPRRHCQRNPYFPPRKASEYHALPRGRRGAPAGRGAAHHGARQGPRPLQLRHDTQHGRRDLRPLPAALGRGRRPALPPRPEPADRPRRPQGLQRPCRSRRASGEARGLRALEAADEGRRAARGQPAVGGAGAHPPACLQAQGQRRCFLLRAARLHDPCLPEAPRGHAPGGHQGDDPGGPRAQPHLGRRGQAAPQGVRGALQARAELHAGGAPGYARGPSGGLGVGAAGPRGGAAADDGAGAHRPGGHHRGPNGPRLGRPGRRHALPPRGPSRRPLPGTAAGPAAQRRGGRCGGHAGGCPGRRGGRCFGGSRRCGAAGARARRRGGRPGGSTAAAHGAARADRHADHLEDVHAHGRPAAVELSCPARRVLQVPRRHRRAAEDEPVPDDDQVPARLCALRGFPMQTLRHAGL
mmetsp:Transcript_39956/g.95574  ORF Transcript_39956/g.95574 Transcript_39956/m.95574 type:complete len:487 (+) Transcript_39956:1202-2662(+)